jgi:hypothetical protein
MRLAQNADNAAAGANPPLVQLLGPGSPAEVHEIAAGFLMDLAVNTENKVRSATDGAIPPLIYLLGPGSPADVQRYAARALTNLSAQNDDVAIDTAGAIPPLVHLLRPGSPAVVQGTAAGALMCLAQIDENAVTIAAAGEPARGCCHQHSIHEHCVVVVQHGQRPHCVGQLLWR